MIVHRSHPLLTAVVAVCLGGTLSAGLYSLPDLVRAGESSLEFVGNLIGKVHYISLDKLDPTYPRYF
jgi:hypothetical protein